MARQYPLITVNELAVAVGRSRTAMNYQILAGHMIEPYRVNSRARVWMIDDVRNWFKSRGELENLAKLDAYLATHA